MHRPFCKYSHWAWANENNKTKDFNQSIVWFSSDKRARCKNRTSKTIVTTHWKKLLCKLGKLANISVGCAVCTAHCPPLDDLWSQISVILPNLQTNFFQWIILIRGIPLLTIKIIKYFIVFMSIAIIRVQNFGRQCLSTAMHLQTMQYIKLHISYEYHCAMEQEQESCAWKNK